MNRRQCLLATAAAFATLHRPSWAERPREEKPRAKGVELYSWKAPDDEWLFALVDGTNRLKTETEVKSAQTQWRGVEPLQQAVGRLAEGEHVSWVHRISGFEYPSKATQAEIEQSAREAKVNLSIGG